MGIESFDWSLEVEMLEKQAVEPTETSLETPRETQSAWAEENSALKDSFYGSRRMSPEKREENCQNTFQPRPESSAGARLLRTEQKLPVGQNHFDAKDARRYLKKRLDLNTWREELARRDDDKISYLQPHVATTRTETVTSAVTNKQIPPRPLITPMSAGQDTLDIWTVRNNLRKRYDLNSWRQP
ncbi:hypothetical protein HF086_018048 [Spodoptera exigua]|uniref:Uncharacterized protein n=1 Tax=Spodoptera exigua TaxID=7107 RepID=A0A922N0C1_SPOEX|nr:hypothetical protein HF086_018048 [Spodoptera exigua]